MIGPDSSLLQMLSDPDEGPFLRELIGQTRRAAVLSDYAQHLEGRRDRRGEFLRLESLLSGGGHGGELTPARQARHRELLRTLAPFATWLGVVRQTDRVLNCGLATDESPAVRFRFRCPRSWEGLAPPPEPGVRLCDDCQREVHYCDGVGAAEQHARAGHCIAVPRHVTAAAGEELIRHVVGMPDVHALWGERLFPTGPAVIPPPEPGHHPHADRGVFDRTEGCLGGKGRPAGPPGSRSGVRESARVRHPPLKRGHTPAGDSVSGKVG